MHAVVSPQPSLEARIASVDWDAAAAALDEDGAAVLPSLLRPAECASLVALYEAGDEGFRKRIVMARHGYGRGEYKYFAYPLPPVVATLRERLYPRLVGVANRWNEALDSDVRFPDEHAAFLERCHAAGQTRPTPLLLAYETGDYNRLHQDLYGEHVFPVQATVLLSRPESDFSGGEFVLVEQRARMQSRAEVVPLAQGDAVIFAVNQRPVISARGFTRVTLRHGVSKLRTGARMTLGVIFHDAK